MEIDSLKQELIEYSKKAYMAGLNPAMSGNISVRTKNNTILISATASFFSDIKEDDIVEIDFSGNVVNGIKKPSSEKLMHIEIYKKREDIQAVIHSHSPEITAFAVLNKNVNKILTPEFALYFGNVPLAKYKTPSSISLAVDIGEHFLKNNAVLMQNHGIVAGGKNLKETFGMLELFQGYAKTYIFSKILGRQRGLTKKELAQIEKLKSK